MCLNLYGCQNGLIRADVDPDIECEWIESVNGEKNKLAASALPEKPWTSHHSEAFSVRDSPVFMRENLPEPGHLALAGIWTQGQLFPSTIFAGTLY